MQHEDPALRVQKEPTLGLRPRWRVVCLGRRGEEDGAPADRAELARLLRMLLVGLGDSPDA